MARTKDTEPARLATFDSNSRAAEKEKEKALAGMRAAAEGRKTAAKKRAHGRHGVFRGRTLYSLA